MEETNEQISKRIIARMHRENQRQIAALEFTQSNIMDLARKTDPEAETCWVCDRLIWSDTIECECGAEIYEARVAEMRRREIGL